MEQQLLEKVDALVMQLRRDPLYKQLENSHRELLENKRVTEVVEKFKLLCERREPGDINKYDPVFKAQLHEAKIALDTHPVIQRHKALERAFTDKLNEIEHRLADAVSTRIPRGHRPFFTGGRTCTKEKA